MAAVPEMGGDDPRVRGRLGRLWSGQVPLVVAFWGFLITGTFLVGLLTFTLTYTVDWAVICFQPEAWWTSSLLDIAGVIVFASYGTIALVGVWRSAGAYSGNWRWGILARVWVIFVGVPGAARIIGRLVDDVSHLFGG